MHKIIDSPPETYLDHDIVSRIVIPYDEARVRLPSENEIIHHLSLQLAEVIAKDCSFIHYKKSVITNQTYSGFYDYIPADDPICDTVYEAHYPKLRQALEKIKKLEEENKRLSQVISGLRHR